MQMLNQQAVEQVSGGFGQVISFLAGMELSKANYSLPVSIAAGALAAVGCSSTGMVMATHTTGLDPLVTGIWAMELVASSAFGFLLGKAADKKSFLKQD